MSREAPLTPVRLARKPGERLGLVVFGGSFDPPHRWHIRAVLAARTHLDAPGAPATNWWIVLIPAARSPLKAQGPVAGDADRLAMARLAVRGLPRALVWPDEIARARWWRRARDTPSARGVPPASFTIDTIRRLRRSIAERSSKAPAALRLLIGSDQAVAFHRWRSFRALMRVAEPLVVLRPPVRTQADFRSALQATGAWSPAEIEAWMRRVVPMKGHRMSSTGVREGLVKGGRALNAPWLSKEVRAYIARHGLYVGDDGTPKPRGAKRPRHTVPSQPVAVRRGSPRAARPIGSRKEPTKGRS